MGWTIGQISSGEGPFAGVRFGAEFGTSSEPIAIEFRGGYARMLQLRADRDRPVLAAACVAWNPLDPGGCAEAIRAALKSGGFRPGRCVLGLPFAFARAETLTVLEGDDGTILRDLSRRRPWRHGITDPELGLMRLGPAGEGRVDIALVIADRPRIERLTGALIDHDVLPDAAEPSFVSVARACSCRHRRATDDRFVRIGVDLHEEGAVAMLLAGDRIVHCVSVDDREEIAGAIAVCAHDGAPHALGEIAEIRLAGVGADAPELRRAIASACDLPVCVGEEEAGEAWRRLRDAIGVRGDPAGGVADWAGVCGLAARPRAGRAREERKVA